MTTLSYSLKKIKSGIDLVDPQTIAAILIGSVPGWIDAMLLVAWKLQEGELV